jgi:hypothetical protein
MEVIKTHNRPPDRPDAPRSGLGAFVVRILTRPPKP